MSLTRWQIWGRYREGREMFIENVLVHDHRSDELAEAANAYGSRWFLWLEAFPIEHPHRALQRRLAQGLPPVNKGGRPSNASKAMQAATVGLDDEFPPAPLVAIEDHLEPDKTPGLSP